MKKILAEGFKVRGPKGESQSEVDEGLARMALVLLQKQRELIREDWGESNKELAIAKLLTGDVSSNTVQEALDIAVSLEEYSRRWDAFGWISSVNLTAVAVVITQELRQHLREAGVGS